MDDLKSKFMGLIQKQGHLKIPIVGPVLNDPTLSPETEGLDDQESEQRREPEQPSDQEILESIESEYYKVDEEFDPCRYELMKILPSMDTNKIKDDLSRLRQQHQVVSKQVLQMILEKQTACQEQFKQVIEVQGCIDEVLSVVRCGRENLGIATRHFTTASLGILANYRKRTLVLQLLRYLKALKTLQRTEYRVQELQKEGDFYGAINLLLESLKVAELYSHFKCVTALTCKLKDTLDMAEENLDVALGKICCDFDEAVYSKLQSAYNLLGRTETFMDQLNMHFTSAVHNCAFNVVFSFTDPSSQTGVKKQYSQLCESVSDEKLIPCLLELCRAMWCIVLSYNSVVIWHRNNPHHDLSGSGYKVSEQYAKLENGLTKLWNDVQTRVSSLVLSANLANYKFDDFLQVLSILHRLSQVGEELCGSDSKDLANSVKTQSSNYFKTYHAARLDDLRTVLENEPWTPWPVRADFTLLHLQEFRGLRYRLEQCAGVMPRHDNSIDGGSVGTSFFSRFPEPQKATPFDSNFEVDTRDEDILASIPCEPSEYFSEDSDEDQTDRRSSDKIGVGRMFKGNNKKDEHPPLLTNTTLTVLRHCGKYLQMSRLLKSISVEVVTALCQLFDYYLYNVHSFFTADTPPGLSTHVTSFKLQAVLKRIRDNLIKFEENEVSIQKVAEAQISTMVDLGNRDTLYGLSERVVAVESLVFLSSQYKFLKPYLEQLLQSQEYSTHFLDQFYLQCVSVSVDVRKPVYFCVVLRAIDMKRVLTMMSKVDWEVKEVMSQSSPYVDVLLKDFQDFSKKLEEWQTQLSAPAEVVTTLWENIAHHLSYILVEGFSSSKKCSNGGRALMQLDYTQLVSKLEKLSNLRPIPHREYVEAYVKAVYKPEEELEVWIREHNEYTSKQLLALVSSALPSNKKSRQRLIAIIEEMDKSR